MSAPSNERLSNGLTGTTIFRGVLALSVALHHADVFHCGYFPPLIGRTAVIAFFVLSGWVMTWFFCAPPAKPVAAKIADFFGRRMFRLGPVLIINFIAVSLAMGKVMPWEIAGLLPLTVAPLGKFFNHILWTLFVEIQFYLFVPFALWSWGRRVMSVRAALLTYAGLFLIPRAYGVLIQGLSWSSAMDMRSFIGNACYFFAGVWLCRAVTVQKNNPLLRWRTRSLAWGIALLMSLAAGSYMLAEGWYWGLGVHAAVLATLLVIEVSRRIFPTEKSPAPAFLRPLYHLGILSYGYYVFHGLCMGLVDNQKFDWLGPAGPGTWLGFVVMVILPVPMAWLAYHAVEQPCSAFYLRKGWRTWRFFGYKGEQRWASMNT